MSRTFRRKNYEKTQGNSWDRRGDKTAGYYTVAHGHLVMGMYRWSRLYEFREPTKQEFYEKYWTVHGDDHSFNDNEPCKWLRKHKMSQNRTHNKHELELWVKYPDEYEPVFESKPRLHPWEMIWD